MKKMVRHALAFHFFCSVVFSTHILSMSTTVGRLMAFLYYVESHLKKRRVALLLYTVAYTK